MITHASLFSGIGAPELAASWLGWKNVFHCEINPFCRKILNYWFPNSISYEDITTTDFTEYGIGGGKIDVLSGGFPCQPFSHAGKRNGTDDDRYLWPQMLRAIREIHPLYVLGENVSGILSMVQPGSIAQVGHAASLFGEDNEIYFQREQKYVVETVCSDLEREGYSVQPIVIPACAVGAPHIRNRVWFLAKRNDAEYTLRIRRKRRSSTTPTQDIINRNIGAGVGERICSPTRNNAYTIDTGVESLRERTKSPNTVGDITNTDGYRLRSPEWNGGREWATMDDKRQNKSLAGIERPRNERTTTDTIGIRWQTLGVQDGQSSHSRQTERGTIQSGRTDCTQDRWRNFPTQSPVCRGNDGVSIRLDNLAISFNKWRSESIKAYGNSMVPQLVYEIYSAIQNDYYNNINQK